MSRVTKQKLCVKLFNLIISINLLIPSSLSYAQICNYRFNITISGQQYEIPYCSSTDISKGRSKAQHAIFVIHGTNRNADDYYDYMKQAAELANDKNTIIIAPQFLTKEDVAQYSLPSTTLYWSNSGWKQGNKSQSVGRISSFEVLEKFTKQLSKFTKNIHAITVTGHSAGGQYVNRYAAGNSIEDDLPSILFRYMPANPSSYLYFSPDRAWPGTESFFYIPYDNNCTEYDDYKYGLQQLNKTGYMANVGSNELANRYYRRYVTYLLGSDDIDDSDDDLDTSCSAMYQGQNRYQRGNIYYNYLGFFFGYSIYYRQGQIIVPNVAHSAKDIYTTPSVYHYLFHEV